ncbi:MAG: hypothetical protein JNM41_09455 [Flavipsychrobacter sp.]|nr:hypothetical protein [Flavipsychrobacter sp.]
MKTEIIYNDMGIPPETELLFKYLQELKEELLEHGSHYSVVDLYDDVPTRAYFMLRIFDELDFFTLYPSGGEYHSP